MIDELYILDESEGIKKDGHIMFLEDVVKDLNCWRNEARSFRNKNAKLLKEIGRLRFPKNKKDTLPEKSEPEAYLNLKKCNSVAENEVKGFVDGMVITGCKKSAQDEPTTSDKIRDEINKDYAKSKESANK